MSHPSAQRQPAAADLRRVLHQIVASCPEPARLVELYYWSSETELLQFIRRFVALPPEVQRMLCSFLAITKHNPASVNVAASQSGEITLTSPEATEALRIITADQPDSGPMH